MENPVPSFPNEVVNIILGHLEKRQLLECRLVSKSWNELCLKHLTRMEHIQELKAGKVKDYVAFLKESGSTPRFPLKIRFGVSTVLELFGDVDSLITCAGPNSIAELEFGGMPLINHAECVSFCSILERISSELLTFTKPCFMTSALNQDFLARTRGPTFPKLKELRMSIDMDPGVGPNGVELCSVLVAKCPTLKVLRIDGVLSDIRMIPFEIGLETLKLQRVYMSNGLLQDVQKVQAEANRIELKSYTCDFFPVFTWSPAEHNAVKKLLEVLSPKLRNCSYSITKNSQLLLTSSLPRLTSLNIFLAKHGDCPAFTTQRSPIPMSLSPILLPALKSVAVPLGMYWNSPEDLPVILSVVDLTLQARGWESRTPGIQYTSASEIQNCLANVFRAFPNTVRLTLRDWKSGRPSGMLALRKLIFGLMMCPIEGHIRELTVQDYREDYIGKNFLQLKNSPAISIALDKASLPAKSPSNLAEAVSEFFDTLGCINFQITEDSKSLRMDTAQQSLKMSFLKNISKLTLLLPLKDPSELEKLHFQVHLRDDQSQLLEDTPAARRILYLNHISKCFPHLRVLEMSAGILNANYLTAWKLAREIESVYHTWTINLTQTLPVADD